MPAMWWVATSIQTCVGGPALGALAAGAVSAASLAYLLALYLVYTVRLETGAAERAAKESGSSLIRNVQSPWR